MRAFFTKLIDITESDKSIQLDAGEKSFLLSALKSAKRTCIGKKAHINKGKEWHLQEAQRRGNIPSISYIESCNKQIEEEDFYLYRLDELINKLNLK